MSLELGNNLCSGALHQVEPVAETLINSRGKYHYSSNSIIQVMLHLSSNSIQQSIHLLSDTHFAKNRMSKTTSGWKHHNDKHVETCFFKIMFDFAHALQSDCNHCASKSSCKFTCRVLQVTTFTCNAATQSVMR